MANLSKSDTDNKIIEILGDYVEFFDDEKFITSRQCIQNVWKIAISNEFCYGKILSGLERTYNENIHINKHGNLIKQDVVSSMLQIFQNTHNSEIMERIEKLINSENDKKLIKSLRKIIN